MYRKALFWLLLAMAPWGVAEDGFVVVCPIEDMIDDGVAVFVERAVEEARGAKAIIFEVDTPGGLVDAAIEISKSIMSADCRTIAYIKGMGAISAGALVSYACDEMIMAPDTNMGAATPITFSAEGIQPTSEKEVSFMRAKFRALAERHERNPAIAEAMVDKDIELRLYVDERGESLIYGVYPEATGEAPSWDAASKDPVEIIRKAFEDLPPELEPVKKLAEGILSESEEEKPVEEPVEPDYPAGGQVLLPTGKLLTLTPKEAIKYGVIPATANGLEEVMAYYDLDGLEVRRLEMTWAERVFRFMTNPMVAGLLLMLGIGGLYIEIRTPGFGVPGIIGLICLALFFGSHYVLGMAEVVDILLILAGIGLILVEVFVLPGFGIVGVAGGVCLVAGLYLTLTNVPIPQYSWDFQRLENAGTSIVVATTTLAGLIYVLWKVFPHTPLYGRLVLEHAQLAGKGYVVQTAEQRDAAIGLEGVAVTMLRPAGRGRFGDTTYQVVSRAEYIEKGTPIVIVAVDGNRHVVDRLKEDA